MYKRQVDDILAKTEYWGTDLSFLKPSIDGYLAAIDEKGIRAAMEEVVKD